MNRHLLIFTLGPVQEFIKQARRTRDLWFGSHLLSELSRTAARTLAEEEGAELVFPALRRGDPELRPCWSETREGVSRVRESGKPPVNVANKIVVVLLGDADPEQAARRARDAVRAQWQSVGRYVRARCEAVLAAGIDGAWEEQLDGLLEPLAAWQSFDDAGYVRARREVEEAIAGRKHLKEFSAWKQLRGAVFRSSLDGGRETVLADAVKEDVGRRRLGIAPGEQLDAVSLCKRAGGRPEQFAPTPNIALAQWLLAANAAAGERMAELRAACKAANVRSVQGGAPWRDALPYYADVVLESQCAQTLAEAGEIDDLAEATRWFREYVRPVFAFMPEPHGYLAALVADGDFMGKAIEALTTPEQHRALSRTLARFAAKARELVEGRGGELVYAGGDDVLALVCLPDALACAQALHEAFGEGMRELAAEHPLPRIPTLSVGLGVAHRTEGLGDLLDLGRRAERIAKQPPSGEPGDERNALAIVVTPHSGRPRAWRANWTQDPVARIRTDIATALPLGKVHAIEEVRSRLGSQSGDALRSEVVRILAHGGDGAPALTPDDVDLSWPTDGSATSIDAAVRRFVHRWLIAEVFARAERSTIPHRHGEAAQ